MSEKYVETAALGFPRAELAFAPINQFLLTERNQASCAGGKPRAAVPT